MPDPVVHLRSPHARQRAFIDCTAKRIVIRAGRRGGKTTGIAQRAVKRFLAGRRQLYTAPTAEQVDAFWWEVRQALYEPVEAGIFYKNEQKKIIELPQSKQRITAKTAWNADTLRGDYGDDLYFDEWQLTDEQAWELVGAPMLLDNNGDAVFIYTPPSLLSRSVSKAKDPRHAARLFKKAEADTTGRWAAFHFTSHDNPYLSKEGLQEITEDMTELAFRQEILAEDLEETPGALWTPSLLAAGRIERPAGSPMDVVRALAEQGTELRRLAVGVDPSGGAAEVGILTCGAGPCAVCGTSEPHAFVLADDSGAFDRALWGRAVLDAYYGWKADRIYGERNYGGDMVEHTIRTFPGGEKASYEDANATRGKIVRAAPVAALSEQGKLHLVGEFPELESEMTTYADGAGWSPNRLDALVWAISGVMDLGNKGKPVSAVVSRRARQRRQARAA